MRENFIACPNCGTENRAVKKICYACFKPIGFFPNSPGKTERNARIVEDVKSGTMTYKAIAIRNNISLERVRQIYQRAQRRKDRKRE